MKLLLIAPSTNLQTLQELLHAMAGMQVESLASPVTAREALGQIASNQYEGIHFAGDITTGVLAFTDGPLEVALLVNALNSAPFIRFVILNGCDSLAMAVDVYMQTHVPCVIGWPEPLSDDAGQAWAATFYRALRLTGVFVDAMHSAGEMLRRLYPTVEPPRLLNGRVGNIKAELVAAQKQLDSDLYIRMPKWLVAAMVAIIMLLICLQLLEAGLRI
jgi:hypothetical protein